MAVLGAEVVGLTSANEAIQKEKEEETALLAMALADNASLRAEVDTLKKDSKNKKKVEELEEEVATLQEEVSDLQNEADDLDVARKKADQASKVAFQDGFCLAHHQFLKKYPDLDLSFLAAMDIPEGPRWSWSKIEFLNLPPSLLPKTSAKVSEAGASYDAGAL